MRHDITEIANHAMSLEPYPNDMFPPSPYYRFLKMLAEKYKPNVMVELGVCGGGGSLHLALGNPEGTVIGVDVVRDYPEQIDYIEETCQNFFFYKMDSVDSAKVVSDIYGQVDLLFIDTDHTYEQTCNEVEAYAPFLSENAIVCFDDLNRPGVSDFWDELGENKIRLDYLHPGTYPEGGGFGVWTKQL